MWLKLDINEIHPVYYESPGFNVPTYEVEIPDELWLSYKKSLGAFLEKLDELTEYLYND